jgi:hypothetical protein
VVCRGFVTGRLRGIRVSVKDAQRRRSQDGVKAEDTAGGGEGRRDTSSISATDHQSGERSHTMQYAFGVVQPGARVNFDTAKLANLSLPDSSDSMHRLGDLWATDPHVLLFLRHFG